MRVCFAKALGCVPLRAARVRRACQVRVLAEPRIVPAARRAGNPTWARLLPEDIAVAADASVLHRDIPEDVAVAAEAPALQRDPPARNAGDTARASVCGARASVCGASDAVPLATGAPPAPLRSTVPWPKRLPRRASLPSVSVHTPAAVHGGLGLQTMFRRHQQPAALLPAPSVLDAHASAPPGPPSAASRKRDRLVTAMAARLTAGRTQHCLDRLARTRLFAAGVPHSAGTALATAGLCADLDGEEVYILKTFFRRESHLADIIFLVSDGKGGARADRRRVRTVPVAALLGPGVRYTVEVRADGHGRTAVLFGALPAASTVEALPATVCDQVALLLGASARGGAGSTTQAETPAVRPASMLAHLAQTRQKGFPHSVVPRTDQDHGITLLDVPVPRVLGPSVYRCRTCRRVFGRYRVFKVSAADVVAALPNVLVHRPTRPAKRERVLYMTRAFVLTLVAEFHDTLNARAVRRHLASLYQHSLLAWAVQQDRLQLSPYSLAWQLRALPRCRMVRDLLLRALSGFVGARVADMQRSQFLYNGQGIRHDGNYTLARRVLVRKPDERRGFERPYSVALAFCGVDGSLLAPITLRRTEDWPDIEADLEPLLHAIKRVRMEGPAAQSCARVLHVLL
jgi:hypothetical protein